MLLDRFSVMRHCQCLLFICKPRVAEVKGLALAQYSGRLFCKVPRPLQFNIKEQEDEMMSTEKRNDSFHKASSILSVAAILLTIALLARMETVVHDTKMMDSKFTLEIQQIKDALKEERASQQARVKEIFLNVVSGK